MTLLPLLISLVLMIIHSSTACTEFIVSCKDNTTIVGRTMEFAINFNWNIISTPKGIQFQATVPKNCHDPLEWTSQHKVIYLNTDTKAIGGAQNIWLDGQNDAGLSVGVLYFPNYSWFPKTVPTDACPNALSHLEVAKYILTKYSTVKEVQAAFDDDAFPFVWEQSIPVTHPDGSTENFVFPLHWSIIDRSGDAIVLEYTEKEGRRIFINEVGVFTNSPTYDWHTTNLNNYVNIQGTEAPARKYRRNNVEYSIKPFGHGSGMLGLPGDFTPPSRFIRTAAFVRMTKQSETVTDGLVKSWHIINSVDISKDMMEGMTCWVVVKDLKNNIMYYRGQTYLGIRKIDMNKTSNTKETSIVLEDDFESSVEDVTDQMRDNKQLKKRREL